MKSTIKPPTTFGLELEYAGQHPCGSPASTINGQPLVDAFLQEIDPRWQKQIDAIGGIKEEVFKHQREIYTHPGTLAETLDKAVCLHQIITEQMKKLFNIKPSPYSKPLPYPGGGKKLLSEKSYYIDSMTQVNSKGHLMNLVTPRSYYQEAINDIADTEPDNFAIARNASTSSTHLHMSCDTKEDTMKLCYALIAHCSQSIIHNTSTRRQDRGMSLERFKARSRIVNIRNKLGEVIDPFNAILLPQYEESNRHSWMMHRYFPKGDTSTPARDHTPIVLKKPSTFTTEIRTADGPGADENNIYKQVNTYIHHIQQAQELSRSSF